MVWLCTHTNCMPSRLAWVVLVLRFGLAITKTRCRCETKQYKMNSHYLRGLRPQRGDRWSLRRRYVPTWATKGPETGWKGKVDIVARMGCIVKKDGTLGSVGNCGKTAPYSRQFCDWQRALEEAPEIYEQRLLPTRQMTATPAHYSCKWPNAQECNTMQTILKSFIVSTYLVTWDWEAQWTTSLNI